MTDGFKQLVLRLTMMMAVKKGEKMKTVLTGNGDIPAAEILIKRNYRCPINSILIVSISTKSLLDG